MQKSDLPFDAQEAKLFFDILVAGDSDREEFTFQTIDDNKPRNNKELTMVLRGRLIEVADRLEQLNRRGAGVYVAVNKLRPGRRITSNVLSVRALFVDLDGAPLDPVWDWSLLPHLVVESSPRKFHVYWRVDNSVPLIVLPSSNVNLPPYSTVIPPSAIYPVFSDCLEPGTERYARTDHALNRSSQGLSIPPTETKMNSGADIAFYNLDALEAALVGIEEKRPTVQGKRRERRAQLPAPVRRKRGELDAREYLNQEALFRVDEWASRVPGVKKHATGRWRGKPADLGRVCEEDLSITAIGIRDFGQEWEAPVGYTPIEVVKAFAEGVDEHGNLVLAEFDEEATPKGTLSDREACCWLAAALGMNWDQLWHEDIEKDFGDPPFTTSDFSILTKEQIVERIYDLQNLKLMFPAAYEEIRDWLDLLSIIDALELDTLVDGSKTVAIRSRKYILLSEADTLPDAHDFVEDFLCEGQLSVVFGDANVGKTFIVFDLAMRAARGKKWSGKETDRGLVIYIAGEGAGGMKRRIAAYLKHHGIEDASDIPFVLIPEMINFRDPQSVEALVATVKEIGAHFGMPVRWIIVDTLNRALAGGNENASEDMGALVRGADRVRVTTGAHVTFIHHTGKDESKGARGHSSLRGAADTEVEIRRAEGGAISVTATKQRDLEIGRPFAFRLAKVELGTNKRGKTVTSCIVEEAVIKPALSEVEHEALEILNTMLFDSEATNVPLAQWRKAVVATDGLLPGETPDARSKQWQRLRDGLKKKGAIDICDGKVWTKHR